MTLINKILRNIFVHRMIHTFHHIVSVIANLVRLSKSPRRFAPRIFATRAMSQMERRKKEIKPRGFINSQDGSKKSVALIQRCCDTISRKSPSNNRRIIKASSPQRQTTCVRSFGLASLSLSLSHVIRPRDIIKPFISRPRAPS